MLTYPIFEGYSRKVMTLTMIFKNDEILLGMKNRGMGKGKWNGFGGKVEPNETVDAAAKREVKEECGLDVMYMEKIGIIEFEYVGSNELLEGHIYFCDLFNGEIIESDEMSPIKWFKLEDTPCKLMWIDHTFWFPLIVKRIPFKAHFKYLNDDTMVDSTIILLNSTKKTREILVNVVIKRDDQILLYNNIKRSKYLNKHEQVLNGECIEDVAIRTIKKYKISTEKLQKIAVVDIEHVDKPYIEEINFFVVNISEQTNSLNIEDAVWLDIKNIPEKSSWPDKIFLSTLCTMKPFKSYFLIDENSILCNKYYQ